MSSIQKRENGRWRARYRDVAGKEHARHFDRKTDAQRWLDEVTASVVTGAYVDPRAGRVTFDGYFREWASRQVWEDNTARAMDLTRRSVTFGDVPMAVLRASHLEAWVKGMAASGLAPTTMASRMSNVRAVLKAAVRDRITAVDPSVGVSTPRKRRAEHAMQIPSAELVGRLVEASEPPMRAFVALCAFAGLRLGEASAVTVADVDFLRRTLAVQRQVQRRRGGPPEVRAPKYGSERVVPLADDLLTLLSWHIEHVGVADEGWFFFTAEGNPLPPTTVNGAWTRARTAAGAGGVTVHTLRHFYASGLIAAGCDVVTVQRAMGHSSASVTLDTYSHLWPNAEDRTRRAVEGMLSAALPRPADYLRTGVAQ